MNHHINILQRVKVAHLQSGTKPTRNIVRAEAILLKDETNHWIAERLTQVGNLHTISSEIADIIIQSPRGVTATTPGNLFRSLSQPGQSFVLREVQPGGKHLWSWEEKQHGREAKFWPFPVDASALRLRKDNRPYAPNRTQVLNWDRAVVFIDPSSLAKFAEYLRLPEKKVRAVIQSSDSVVAIFAIQATYYLLWRDRVRALSCSLKSRGVLHKPISMQDLAPIPNNSRGDGSLIYLA